MFLYFAYGSNMLTRRLAAQERAPSARFRSCGFVSGRRLTFSKVSRDGSGKCDAELSDSDDSRVYGVVFEIILKEKAALDKAEGFGSGYECEKINVETDRGILSAITYIATKKKEVLRPYHWYKALVVAGAVEHKLPDEYIESLRAVESVEDPNAKRRFENEAFLYGG